MSVPIDEINLEIEKNNLELNEQIVQQKEINNLKRSKRMLEEKISKLKSEQEAQIKDKVIDRLKKENVMQNYIISQYRKYQKDSSKPDELIISTLNKGPTRIRLK